MTVPLSTQETKCASQPMTQILHQTQEVKVSTLVDTR